MARDFRKQIKEHQTTTTRVAIQQIDPGDTESRPVPPAPPPVPKQALAESAQAGGRQPEPERDESSEDRQDVKPASRPPKAEPGPAAKLTVMVEEGAKVDLEHLVTDLRSKEKVVVNAMLKYGLKMYRAGKITREDLGI
jgi:hypothetical protein